MLVQSCGDRVGTADSAFLPPAPRDLAEARQADPRPVLPIDAVNSEAAYDRWNNDALDWGERRDLLAFRWCSLYNSFAPPASRSNCGPRPEGVD